MKSKIINMADRLKDKEDLKLEAMFGSEAVADDGFSRRVVSRVRRRIWVQRLSLPIAFVVGGAIAVKPLSQFVAALAKLRTVIPQNVGGQLEKVPLEHLPPLSTMLMAVVLVMVLVMAGKLLQE